jgi:hypothetical protein
MDLITAEEVVRRIETYFLGGALEFLGSKTETAQLQAV